MASDNQPDHSIFMDPKPVPGEVMLSSALGKTFEYWESISKFVLKRYPEAISEWNFSGAKYGWSYRIKDKKKAIIYLLPRDGFFKAAFVFGQKATDKIVASSIRKEIKEELLSARVYAEGRGIRIEIKDRKILDDIFQLVEIKLGDQK
jgi:hypothetical protein